ncbi:MAG: hypothetical protein IPO60_02285 [Flavobacteriales bacterium]|nr:hypothetical protein [Flavobacteriales bacterium]
MGTPAKEAVSPLSELRIAPSSFFTKALALSLAETESASPIAFRWAVNGPYPPVLPGLTKEQHGNGDKKKEQVAAHGS